MDDPFVSIMGFPPCLPSILQCSPNKLKGGRMHPVKLFCWHFMAFPYLPEDFDDKYDNDWVTVPNSLWDRDRKWSCK